MAMSTPGMTRSNAFDSHPTSFKRTPFFNGLNGVGTACWRIPATRGEYRRNNPLINFNRKDEDIIDVFQELHLFDIRLTFDQRIPALIQF